MKIKTPEELKDGDQCEVTGGTHAGKSGLVRDINTSKTGHITVTVEQKNGVRFKTLGRNVTVEVKGRTQQAGVSKNVLQKEIQAYNDAQLPEDKQICNLLAQEINRSLSQAENKIWHAHPVWFLDGNPIVGYSKLKDSVRLLFWSGQSFDEDALQNEGSFKAAEMRYTSVAQIKKKDLTRWLKKSAEIQWDYKNIVKRKGQLERLK
jgi:hypothetical protein